MDNVENFITTYPTRPGRICSYLISLDENGDISHYRVTGGGGNFSQSSSEMVDAYYRRIEKKKEYERIAEENALKRKLQEQETDRRYYQNSITKESIY
jgi:hypothetical protein